MIECLFKYLQVYSYNLLQREDKEMTYNYIVSFRSISTQHFVFQFVTNYLL